MIFQANDLQHCELYIKRSKRKHLNFGEVQTFISVILAFT